MLGVAPWGGEVREAGLGRICWDGPAVSCHNWAGPLHLHVDQSLCVVASREGHVFSKEVPFSEGQVPKRDLANACWPPVLPAAGG